MKTTIAFVLFAAAIAGVFPRDTALNIIGFVGAVGVLFLIARLWRRRLRSPYDIYHRKAHRSHGFRDRWKGDE